MKKIILLFLSIFYYSFLVAQSSFPTDNLIMYLPINSNSDNMSENNIIYNVVGARLTADEYNRKDETYLFDGSYDYLDFGVQKILQLEGNLTISFKIYINSFSKKYPTIISCQADNTDNNNTNCLYKLNFYGNNILRYSHESGHGLDHIVSFDNFLFENDRWYSVVLTRKISSKTLSLFVDGSLVDTRQYLANPDNGGLSKTRIGEDLGTVESERFFDGKIDEFRLYDICLETKDAEFLSNQLLVPQFESNINEGYSPLQISFFDSSYYFDEHSKILSWEWDFGDGNTSNLQNPKHTFQDEGKYTISLKLEGMSGINSVVKQNLITVIQPVIADFKTSKSTGRYPFTVNFTDLSIGEIYNWHWDFGDGNFSQEQNPVNTYNQAGFYDVSLIVEGPAGKDTVIKNDIIMVIDPKPVAQFMADTTQGLIPLTIQFIDQSEGKITKWEWDFGDEQYSNDRNPIHTYNKVGTYTVSLLVFGSGGTTREIKENYITVKEPVPVADFLSDTTQGLLPLTIKFEDNSSGNITYRKWEFGDGQESTEINPIYTYHNAGIFSVKLTVSGASGTNSKIKNNYIHVLQPNPIAGFSADTTYGSFPFTVNFFDSSQGMIDNWFWDFGDGVFSNEKNPSHTYQEKGTYTVTLMVSGSGGTDTLSRTNFIKVIEAKPVADFVVHQQKGSIPFIANFSDSSIGQIESWYWNFGDGTISNEQNPKHTYDSIGIFDVTLKIFGPGGSDSLKKDQYVIVTEKSPIASFYANELSGSYPFNVHFFDSSTGIINSRNWDFGDGYSSTLKDPVHEYSEEGVFTVSLNVSGPGGTDSIIRKDYITVILPTDLEIGDKIIPEIFALHQNFPNPFNPVTNISFSLPKSIDVSIIIYNLSGQVVTNLVEQYLTAGIYNVQFNAENLTSGIYFISMRAGNFNEIKKCLLLK